MPGNNLGTFSLLVGIVGATLLTGGMTSSHLSKDGSGVWNVCTVEGCLAVRVMMVISAVFGILHVLILLLYLVKEVGPNTQKIITSVFISALLTAIFGLVSIIVYKAKLEADGSFTLGSTFGTECAGVAIILFNIIVILLERRRQRKTGAYLSI
ncbi:hypothetical protein ACJMK2_002210 [Sinanodonta woodiana]|uniref:Uncharacterized protein n=1 Tax=Sinanodonta woodiana TaxID=1069815 RepID=A0ABD3XXX8_SINWO